MFSFYRLLACFPRFIICIIRWDMLGYSASCSSDSLISLPYIQSDYFHLECACISTSTRTDPFFLLSSSSLLIHCCITQYDKSRLERYLKKWYVNGYDYRAREWKENRRKKTSTARKIQSMSLPWFSHWKRRKGIRMRGARAREREGEICFYLNELIYYICWRYFLERDKIFPLSKNDFFFYLFILT